MLFFVKQLFSSDHKLLWSSFPWYSVDYSERLFTVIPVAVLYSFFCIPVFVWYLCWWFYYFRGSIWKYLGRPFGLWARAIKLKIMSQTESTDCLFRSATYRTRKTFWSTTVSKHSGESRTCYRTTVIRNAGKHIDLSNVFCFFPFAFIPCKWGQLLLFYPPQLPITIL